MATLTLLMVRSDLTLPSENTVKLSLDVLPTVTVGNPASCTTLNGAELLDAVSFVATILAAAMIALVTTTGAGGVTGVCPLFPPPPPQPTIKAASEQVMLHRTNKRFIFFSVTLRISYAVLQASFAEPINNLTQDLLNNLLAQSITQKKAGICRFTKPKLRIY
jgi:hypothetical protein